MQTTGHHLFCWIKRFFFIIIWRIRKKDRIFASNSLNNLNTCIYIIEKQVEKYVLALFHEGIEKHVILQFINQ